MEKYKCPENFAPVFFEDALTSLDENLTKEAENICGNEVTCLFDIAATKQTAFGQSTLSEMTMIDNELAEVRKYLSLYIAKSHRFIVFQHD